MPDFSQRGIDLSIIIVNYNSSEVLYDCLRSVYVSTTHAQYEIIVVDNHSITSIPIQLKAAFPQVQYVELEENLGFAGGSNKGIRISRGKTVLLLNPDTEVEAGAVQVLYDKLTENPAVGVAGPKIRYPDGSLQTRHIPKQMPTVFNFFCELFYLDKLFPRSPVMNSYFGADFDFGKEQFLGQVSGACFMIKKEVIDKIGLLDERLFLYFDEADWCVRALRAGYKVLYVPSASVMHHEGKSADQNLRKSRELYLNSQSYLIRKHQGLARAILLYFVNLLGYTFRLFALPYYLLKDKNTYKVRINLFGLLYHLNIIHFIRVFQP